MKKILITGAGSYIGMSVEQYLMQWPEKYQVDTVDMRDDSWKEKSFSGYDAVYHVAGIAHSDYGKISPERAELYYRVNTHLAVDTARKAKEDGVKQFVFMSTISIYGASAPIGKDKIVYRDTPAAPVNSYGDSKVQAEKGILPLQDDNFKVAVLRPPMIYGRGCKGNYCTLNKLAKKLPFFPYVDNQRSMLYIGNLVEFVRLIIENEESGIFWPQNNEYTNTSEMVKMIAQVHDKHVFMVKGFKWALKIMSCFTGMVDKAFGSLRYDHEMSRYKQEYCLKDLAESIRETEAI